jgi:small-conductance mechanosensitive channel
MDYRQPASRARNPRPQPFSGKHGSESQETAVDRPHPAYYPVPAPAYHVRAHDFLILSMILGVIVLAGALAVWVVVESHRSPTQPQPLAELPPDPPSPEVVAQTREFKALQKMNKVLEERLDFLKKQESQLARQLRAKQDLLREAEAKVREAARALSKTKSELAEEKSRRLEAQTNLETKQAEVDTLKSQMEKLAMTRQELEKKVREQPARVEAASREIHFNDLKWPELFWEKSKLAAPARELRRLLESLDQKSDDFEKRAWSMKEATKLVQLLQTRLEEYPVTDLVASSAQDFLSDIQTRLVALKR